MQGNTPAFECSVISQIFPSQITEIHITCSAYKTVETYALPIQKNRVASEQEEKADSSISDLVFLLSLVTHTRVGLTLTLAPLKGPRAGCSPSLAETLLQVWSKLTK